MRQQYHSRVVDGQRYIWDVNKLVEMTHDLCVIDFPLSSVQELDEAYWYEADNSPPTPRSVAVHAMLISQCDLDYPILLDADGRVMDGMHRCCRALIEKHQTIRAVQFAATPEPHYIDVPFEDLPNDEPVTL